MGKSGSGPRAVSKGLSLPDSGSNTPQAFASARYPFREVYRAKLALLSMDVTLKCDGRTMPVTSMGEGMDPDNRPPLPRAFILPTTKVVRGER